MSVGVMQSILRDLFRDLPSYIATTDQPEEILNRPIQYQADRGWSVETIESYSLPESKKSDTKHIWKINLFCLDAKEYTDFSIKFSYFIDGIQRTSKIRDIAWQSKGYSTVPFLIAQLACIVIKRSNREIQPYVKHSKFKILFEVPIEFLKGNARRSVKEKFEKLQEDKSFDWLDTSYGTVQVDRNEDARSEVSGIKGYYKRIPDSEFREKVVDPNWLANHSRKWTTKCRDQLEQDVFDKLAEETGKAAKDEKNFDFIVKDGTITSKRGKFLQSAIGISKSFNTRFLEPAQQTKVVNLPAYHRSPVFKFTRDTKGTEPDEAESEEPRSKIAETHTVATWYLRLREIDRILPYWGLIRIELHPHLLPCRGSADRWSKADSLLVSSISSSLIAEASPTSHPDPRWHNLLYPIKLCEKYGKSKLIPHETVRYMFNWGDVTNV